MLIFLFFWGRYLLGFRVTFLLRSIWFWLFELKKKKIKQDVWVVKRDLSLCENVALMNTERFKARDLHMSLQGCLTSSVSPCYSSSSQLRLHLPESTDLTIQGQESAPPRHTFVPRLAEGLAPTPLSKKNQGVNADPWTSNENLSVIFHHFEVLVAVSAHPHPWETCNRSSSSAMQPSNIQYFPP